jgi:hypothetical protein
LRGGVGRDEGERKERMETELEKFGGDEGLSLLSVLYHVETPSDNIGDAFWGHFAAPCDIFSGD